MVQAASATAKKRERTRKDTRKRHRPNRPSTHSGYCKKVARHDQVILDLKRQVAQLQAEKAQLEQEKAKMQQRLHQVEDSIEWRQTLEKYGGPSDELRLRVQKLRS